MQEPERADDNAELLCTREPRIEVAAVARKPFIPNGPSRDNAGNLNENDASERHDEELWECRDIHSARPRLSARADNPSAGTSVGAISPFNLSERESRGKFNVTFKRHARPLNNEKREVDSDSVSM